MLGLERTDVACARPRMSFRQRHLDATLPAAVRATKVPKDRFPVAWTLGLPAHGRSAGGALLVAADSSNADGLSGLGFGRGGVSYVDRYVSQSEVKGRRVFRRGIMESYP